MPPLPERLEPSSTAPCPRVTWPTGPLERLLQQLLHLGLDGVGPDLVALFVRVEQVGHDGLGERAIGLEELGADIEEEYFLVVGEALHDRVGGLVLLPELVVLVRAAGEDGENQIYVFVSLIICG